MTLHLARQSIIETRIIWGQSLVPKDLLYFDNLEGTRWTNLSDSA